MSAKSLSYEQARAYIQGEVPFDPTEYEKEHIKRLARVVEEQCQISMEKQEFRENFKKTVEHWIELHRGAENICILISAFEKWKKGSSE